MNSAKKVTAMVDGWKAEGRKKAEIVVLAAEAELGWPYVWGATGQECTPTKREAFVKRESEAEASMTVKKCPVLNGSRAECDGCSCFPGGERVLMDDCQGFVKQILKRVGITMMGAGASSMWKTASNWKAKGEVKDLPEEVCCIFWQNPKKTTTMEHVGFYIGGGWMIHCSGEVKKERLSKKVTHWAIPAGLEGVAPVPEKRPTLRKGSRGEAVKECQEKLMALGYDVGRTGADGIYGTKTAEAVRTFQADHPPMVADGICGQLTWAAIEEALKGGGAVLYTVTIPHLAKHHAEALVGNYTGAVMAPEEGE